MAPIRPLAAPRFVKPDDSDTWHEAGEAEKNVILAALAIIRIEPVAGIPPGEFDELKAQVTFYDSAGGELQRVYHGCWLGDALNHMQLSASGTAELIVASTTQVRSLPSSSRTRVRMQPSMSTKGSSLGSSSDGSTMSMFASSVTQDESDGPYKSSPTFISTWTCAEKDRSLCSNEPNESAVPDEPHRHCVTVPPFLTGTRRSPRLTA